METVTDFIFLGSKVTVDSDYSLDVLLFLFMANGETMETMTDFIFLDSKITADDDCSHEIKRHLLLGRKAVRNHTVY